MVQYESMNQYFSAFFFLLVSFLKVNVIKLSYKLICQGVCQPISKKDGNPLPVWINPNLIFNQCPWCISSRVDPNYNHSGM